MITQSFIDGMFSLLQWVLNSIPADAAPPEWLQGGVAAMRSVLEMAGLLNTWVPVGLVVQMANFMVLAMLVNSSIKMLRLVLSLFTGGGGGAA